MKIIDKQTLRNALGNALLTFNEEVGKVSNNFELQVQANKLAIRLLNNILKELDIDKDEELKELRRNM